MEAVTKGCESELRSVVLIQCYYRQYMSRCHVGVLRGRHGAVMSARRLWAGLLIAKYFRRHFKTNIENKKRLVVLIQTQFRAYLARRRVRALLGRRPRLKRDLSIEDDNVGMFFARHGAALMIQMFIKRHSGRSKVLKLKRRRRTNGKGRSDILAVSAIQWDSRIIMVQQIVRMFVARKRLSRLRSVVKMRPIIRVQCCWRRTLARMRLHALFLKREYVVTHRLMAAQLLSLWLPEQCRKRRERLLLWRGRHKDEQERAGQHLYSLTVVSMSIDCLWRGARQLKHTGTHLELQKFFQTSSQSGMLDMSHALKMVKDSRDCLDKKLTSKFVDLAFTKVKAKTEKKLDYSRFLDFLLVLACKKLLGVDASNKNEEDVLLGPHVEDLYDEGFNFKVGDIDLQRIREYKHGRLRGKAALIISFIDKYLSTSRGYCGVVAALAARSNKNLAAKLVQAAALRINSFLYFNVRFRWWQVISDRRKELLHEELRKRAACRIQAFRRGLRGRVLAMEAAQEVYFKYIDAASSTHYWYNSRTGLSLWSKPRLLRRLDCGFPVLLPTDDSLFTVYCSVCEVKTMQCMCDECDELLCDRCFHKAHKTGLRKMHEAIRIPSCFRCEFQVGTRRCLFCEEAYCDTCYEFEHRKASFRTHLSKWLTDCCKICEKRAAQWVACRLETDYFEHFLCTGCCRDAYGDPQFAEGVSKRRFVGFQVSQRRALKQDTKEKLIRSELYKAQAEGFREIDRLAACISIQRVYRGFISRKHWRPFMAARREFFVVKRDVDRVKGRLRYRLLDLLGFAPFLETDTPREKVLKLFPRVARLVTEECIHHEWEDAIEFLDERERHLEAEGRVDYPRSAYYSILVQLTHRATRSVNQRRENIKHALEELHLKLHGCTDRIEKQRLKKAVELFTTEQDILIIRGDKLEARLKMLQVLHFKYGGPRRLFNTVWERRYLGIPLQLSLQLEEGSQSAVLLRPTLEDGVLAPKINLCPGDELNLQGHIFRVRFLTWSAIDETSGNVTFDRTWNAPNIILSPRIFPSKVAYIVPLYNAMRWMHESFPGQYIINLGARMMNGVSKELDYLISLVEEDSPTAERLKAISDLILSGRDVICRFSYMPVDMDPPYSLRNLGRRGYKKAIKAKTTASKLIRLFGALSVPESPYKTWQRRDGKVMIRCVLRKGPVTEVQLGEFEMHLDAPCEICREYVQRNFRVVLNRTVGDSFGIQYNEQGKSKLLSRSKEARTYSKKVIPFVIDSTSLMGIFVLTLVEDGSELKLIPEFESEYLDEAPADEIAESRKISGWLNDESIK